MLAASVDARSKLASARALHLSAQALELAQGSRERAAALEARGYAAYDLADGDEAWRCFGAAADAREDEGVESANDRAALAMACARACETPTRWPGSMRFAPEDDAVRSYLERGLRAAGAEDSEAKVRLLTAKAFSPWGFRSTHGVVVAMPVDEAREAGEQAAGMAKRLGRVDLESGALDALASSYIVDTDVLAQ